MAAAVGEGSDVRHVTVVIEHLDPELEEWSLAEYKTAAEECRAAGARCCITSLRDPLDREKMLSATDAVQCESRSVEDLHAAGGQQRICLLDPAAEEDLSPADRGQFDVFLFGGILGAKPCLFDCFLT